MKKKVREHIDLLWIQYFAQYVGFEGVKNSSGQLQSPDVITIMQKLIILFNNINCHKTKIYILLDKE